MRIKSINLTWFRGAADPISIEPNSKSMVVYGANGSGKSSFVDAVEYVLNDGKIGHLSHAYSGTRQKFGIPNTHKPKDAKTELRVKFEDDSVLKIEIKPDGSSTSSGAEAAVMATWAYRSTVLRQDEVAEFIHDSKGDKYSALLPLLGLHEMEFAAENLRQIAKTAESESNLKVMKNSLNQIQAKRKEIFGTDTDDQILKTIGNLHNEYCTDGATTDDALSRCNDLEIALATRIARFSADDRRYVALQVIAKVNLKSQIKSIREADVKLAGAIEPLINERLEVLRSTRVFVDKLDDGEEVNCPACGQTITITAFQQHVDAERERLQVINGIFELRKAAVGNLCDTITTLKSNFGKPEVKSWRDDRSVGRLAGSFAQLDSVKPEALRASIGEQDLKPIEDKLLPLVAASADDSKDAPPDVQALSTAKGQVEAGKAVFTAKNEADSVARAEALIVYINSLEQGVREEIRRRSEKLINEISVDMRGMWATLHPNVTIEDVRLLLPPDADKAIDIALKFHGVEQDSPRLTLSEGYRNSLGLCIFLAMAKRVVDQNRPLFLDDVVVSLDRNHRGMVLELLEKEFSDRQVIILTHDREWYTEMRHLLDGNKSWIFKTLLPYETPDIGIRWSQKTTTFDDARAHLKERPDSAGNDVRKIMDIELALIAERLQIRLPYLRSDKNDMRTAHDFLERLVADGKKCFEKKKAGDYAVHTDAVEACEEAHLLLIAWANRASHTFDLVVPEATKLINACEKAIEFFRCFSCPNGPKPVWYLDAGGPEWVQCQCGEIRWRYGKG